MSDQLEVQAEEIEALQAIYPDELQSLSGPPYTFKIKLVPLPGQDNNHVAVDLNCSFPSDYPSIPPVIDVELKKGLASKQKEEILNIIKTQAEDNLGAPSIYTITEAVREWLVDNNVAGQDGSMYSDMMRRMQQKDVEKKKKEVKAAIALAADSEKSSHVVEADPEELERIRKRQAGHPVTAEAFLEWKAKFDAEMLALRIAQFGLSEKDKEDKPTGKQLFLSNRAGLEEALIAAGEQEMSRQLAAAMSAAARKAAGEIVEDEADGDGIAVKEDLFLEDCDEDLDDLLDDDDEDDEDYEDDGENYGDDDDDEEDNEYK
mmetsp:Transcript_17336/g.18075  ORF Transcript_17336/g.18075 Transcript_17336/m.18075 type:complete len:318 (+) Transcript_17336:49-1002(+)